MAISEYQKYPTDKKKWDRNWIKIFGVKCKQCNGKGCKNCNSIGKVERKKKC